MEMDWDSENKIAAAYIPDYDEGDSLEITLGIDSNIVVINQSLKYLDQEPMIIKGRVMVPLRFISEALGSDVSWDQQSNTINIKKGPIKVQQEKDYEIAFTNFIYNGQLDQILREAYGGSNPPTHSYMAFSFYDIDRDGIPELLLTYDTGFSDQMVICEFNNGEVDLLYSGIGEIEEVGATMIRSSFYHDPIKKQLYFMATERYTISLFRYTKERRFEGIYEDSSAGGGETIYYESTFNNKNIKELKMQDFINLDYFAEI